MAWLTAVNWAANLTVGSTRGWRLPTVTDTRAGCDFYAFTGGDCGYNVNTATSEMAHMFYVTLGDKAYYDTSGVGPQSGWGLTNTGPFRNIVSYYYWSATEYAPNTAGAYLFSFNNDDHNGFQGPSGKINYNFAWAVYSGDVGAAIVPLPAAVWLFGGGLLGLIGISRRRKTA